jgi:hypothetical protein
MTYTLSPDGKSITCHKCGRGLPADGAYYVACDKCIKADAPPREVILGYPIDRKRGPIENLSPDVFDHDMKRHHFYDDNMTKH